MDKSWDEYDAYDLSEFSAADFVHIDNTTITTTTATRQDPTTPPKEEVTGEAGRRVVGTGESGGLPQIAVALELAADESVVVKVAGGGSGSGSGGGDSVDAVRRSPFEEFRPRGTLSVSDLVGPAWCEVQFDYGLRQGRSLALVKRPDSFVSAEGKEMAVDKKVAKVREKTLKRGRSVHKKLEREIFPKPVKVDFQSEEEYWAMRLVNMLACLDPLVELGYSREMPVFGIVQGYPIVGVIDEILLKSIPQSEAKPNSRNKRESTSAPQTPQKPKRQREPSPTQSHDDEVLFKSIPQSEVVLNLWNKHASTSASRTPPKSKKQREPSPTQSHITEFFASPSKAKARKSVSPPRPVVRELSLIDTKTRRSNWLPSDDDAFSSRMQLMLYHHLLSALLSPTFSFSAFWEKVRVDPSAQLSDQFLSQSGLAHETDGNIVLRCAECLDDLADLWHLTVRSLQVQGVSPTLEIIYRTRSKSKRNTAAAPEGSHQGKLSDFFGGAADREARDIARAIEVSRREYDPDIQRAIAESLRDVTPREDGVADSGNSVADTQSPLQPQDTEKLPDMLGARWYDRSAATESTQSEAVERDRPMEEWATAELDAGASKTEEPQPKTPGVIGRTRFAFDEAAMQAYVQDVLQWWRGERPPRGVDVEHSRRCFSCEYRDGCEWREAKALEAQEKYVERKFR